MVPLEDGLLGCRSRGDALQPARLCTIVPPFGRRGANTRYSNDPKVL